MAKINIIRLEAELAEARTEIERLKKLPSEILAEIEALKNFLALDLTTNNSQLNKLLQFEQIELLNKVINIVKKYQDIQI